MKAKIIKISLVVMSLMGIAATLAACVNRCAGPVSYYGCPNSKRIEKLNVKKKKVH